MALTHLISDYKDAQRFLSSAIQADCIEKVSEMDRAVEASFDRILAFIPTNDTEQTQLVEFLLRTITGVSTEGPLFKKVNGKILELLDNN